MEERKSSRLREERFTVLIRRFKIILKAWPKLKLKLEGSLPSLRPHFRELVSVPESRAILDGPNEVEVSAADLEVIEPLLPDIIEGWIEKRREYFRSLVRGQVQVAEGVDPLSLAVSASFGCSVCDRFFECPDVLIHNCKLRFEVGKLWASTDPYEKAANHALGALPWTVTAPTLLRGYKQSHCHDRERAHYDLWSRPHSCHASRDGRMEGNCSVYTAAVRRPGESRGIVDDELEGLSKTLSHMCKNTRYRCLTSLY